MMMSKKMELEEKAIRVEALNNLIKGYSVLALLAKTPSDKLGFEVFLEDCSMALKKEKEEKEKIFLEIHG